MARQRRGGGFRPTDLPLRGTLGTLLRTAAAQVGPLREALGDALERTAREGRSRLDDVRARYDQSSTSRRRSDALADLGEIVLDLIRRGEIDLAELPEVRDIVAHLDELDSAAADADIEGTVRGDLRDSRYGHDDEDDAPPARPPARNRFDSRGRDSSRTASSSRSPAPARDRRDLDDDSTTSSRTWVPPKRTSATSAPKPPPRVWRPPVDDDGSGRDTDAAPPAAHARPDAPRSRHPLPGRPNPNKKGGISFEDDDDADLADYMHPDDVPPKDKPPGEGSS